MIRGKAKSCPYGLPIPFGCKTAGKCVSMMSHIDKADKIEDPEASSMAVVENWGTLLSCSDASRCPHADLFVNSKDGDGVAVDCKFDAERKDAPAGNVGLNGSPLVLRHYVGDINEPLQSGPSGYVSDDNNNGLYFGEVFTDLIKGLT
jgi:hypothetical protein